MPQSNPLPTLVLPSQESSTPNKTDSLGNPSPVTQSTGRSLSPGKRRWAGEEDNEWQEAHEDAGSVQSRAASHGARWTQGRKRSKSPGSGAQAASLEGHTLGVSGANQQVLEPFPQLGLEDNSSNQVGTNTDPGTTAPTGNRRRSSALSGREGSSPTRPTHLLNSISYHVGSGEGDVDMGGTEDNHHEHERSAEGGA